MFSHSFWTQTCFWKNAYSSFNNIFLYIIYLLNHACILQLAYKQQQIFQNDAFNWSKMTVMPFIMLPNNFYLKYFLFIKECEKCIPVSTKKYWAAQLFSTLKCFLSSKISIYDSDRSYDTEDRSNGCWKFNLTITWINYSLKYIKTVTHYSFLLYICPEYFFFIDIYIKKKTYIHQNFNQNKFKHVYRLYILCTFTKLNVSYKLAFTDGFSNGWWLDDGYKIDRWIHLSSTELWGYFKPLNTPSAKQTQHHITKSRLISSITGK